MATEANTQESVCLKRGEREENALTSEIFEEKVTELPGNQVKQPETSSHVAETVNTPLVTGKPTNESGIFFQALSVTMVIADEHSNTPESCKAAKQTEPEEEKIIENEEKAVESVTSSQFAAREDIKETTTEEHATIVADFKEQDLNETPREFVKEETESKSVDAKEASEQRENGTKGIEEQKSEESVEKIEKDEEIKEIKPDVETGEQNVLLQAITSDTAISAQTKSVENTEHVEDDTQKFDNPLIKEVCEEKEDNEHEVVKSKESIDEEADVGVSTLVKESIKVEEPDDEKAIEKEVCEENRTEKTELEISDSKIEKEQGDSDGVTSLQESPSADVEETTTVQHVTTAVDLNEKPREFIKEETEDKSLDAPEASEECIKEEIEENPEESVKKTEKEEEIKPGVEIEEKKEHTAITTDVCISTQTKSQVETTEHGEKEQDVNVLEKDQDEDDVTHAREVTFEESLQETSHHNEDNEHEVVKPKESIEEEADVGVSTQTTLVKESIKIEEPDDENSIEKEICEISDSTAPIQKDQGDSGGVTSLQESPSVDVEETTTVQHVTTTVNFKEQDLIEKPREFIKEETEDKSLDAPEASEECEKGAKEEIDQNPEESVKKTEKEEETEEIKPGIEIEEKKEQDELLPAIDSDVYISSQTKSQVEKTEHDEEDTQNDDGLKETSDGPSIKEVCEETGLKKDEYEKEVKHSAIATVTKDENEAEEKEQEVNVLEKDEDEDDVTSARDMTFEKDLQEENHHNEDDVTEVVTAEESREKDTEVIRSCEETEQQMLINSIPSDVCLSTQPEEATEKKDEEAIETEQGLSATQKEIIIEEAEDKPVDAQVVPEQYDDGANDEREQKLEESTNDTAHSTNEQEEHTEEIKPKFETDKEKDVCISTQTESQEEVTKAEENAVESDVDQKEKSDNPFINELCEQKDLKQTESKEERQPSDSSNVKTEESVDEDAKDTKSSDVITTDVYSSTQTEYIEKTIESEEKNDDGQKEKPENPFVEVVCEAKSSEMAESEEGFGTTLNADETLSKEEKLEKEDEIKTSEVQVGGDDVTSSQLASNEDMQETTIGQHDTSVAHVVEGQGVSALPKEILVEEAEDKSIDAEEHSGQNEVSKEIVTDLNETTEVEPQEDITPSTSFETSTEDTSKSEKENAESENLPTEDLETVSQLQIPELVPKSEDSVLKEECFISETGTHLDEEKGTVEKEISSDEKTEVQGDGDDVTNSQNAPNEDIQETTIGQHDTIATYVEEGQGVSATPKEILIEEAEDKSIKVEEMSLELGQANEQNVEETYSCLSKTITEIPEDEIKKEKKDLTHESVEDTNDNTTKEEKGALEHEPVEEHNDRDEISKEKVTDLNETTEVAHQEDITPSTSFETSTEDASNSEKEKAESENFPIEELETVSEVQIPKLVPRSKDSVLKEECFISETKPQLDEEKGTVTEKNSSDEKAEVQGDRDDVTRSQNAPNEDIQETTVGQHDTSVAYVQEEQCVSATPKEILKEETEDKSIDVEETSLKLGQPNEQNVKENISQNPEDEIKKEDKDLSHESVEDTNDNTAKEEKCAVAHEPVEEHSGLDEVSKENVSELNETREVEPQEDITPSISLETSTDDTSNSKKEKPETENLPLEDLETVSEVQIPELVPKPEELVLKEECFITETERQLDEEKGTVTEEISSDEKTEKTTEIKQETVKEVCEETSSEKVEFEEGLKLSDSSSIKINEKEITFEDNEEKDQEVNMSTESQGEDNITSSLIEVSEEKDDLKEKNYRNEGNEGDFLKSGEGVDENEETTENEEKNDEKAIGNDENEIMSRDAILEKNQEDIKETNMGEHATTVASSEEGQSLGTMTKEVHGEAEEGDKPVISQEETEQHDDGENGEGEQKQEEHTKEIKPSVETNEEKDVCVSTQNESQEKPSKDEENAFERDDQKENSDNLFVKEVCEESDLTKTESEERQLPDSSDVKTREIEETKFTDVCSSTQTENIEKTTASEENNEEVTIAHDEGQTKKPQSPFVEVVCEAKSSEIVESKEGVNFSTTLNENETLSKEEILEKEDDIKTSEAKGGGVEVTSSQNASNEGIKETTIGQHDTTVAHVEEGQGVSALPKEILIDAEDKSVDAEEISLEHEQPNEQNVEETHPCLSETISENPEDEIKKENKDLSLESVEDTNDNTTKEEKGALNHEPVEEHSGLDEVSKEKVTDINESTEVEPQEDITPSISLETSTHDTLNSEKEKAEIENLPIKDVETVSEVQIPEVVPRSEESVLKEECFISETETHLDEEKGTIEEEISSDVKTEQTTEIKQETVKEVCEETSSEKAEFEEGLKLSDTSTIKINEKEITFKEDDQEKDQEVNMSAESQGKDNITSSQNEESEEKEDLQEKNDHNERDEGKFIRGGEVVHEDIEEIKYSVETKENTEHIITTISSTQIEPDEETIEKNGEKAVENDKNEIMNREIDLEKKLEDVCSSTQTEPKEEPVEKKEIVSELEGGVDDVVSSQITTNEDTKETTISQHAITTVYFEKGLGVNAITKEIIGEEVEDKSIHVVEASEQSENEAKDKIQQQPEESINKPVNSCSETIEGSVKEEEADAGNKKEIESKLEVENQADKTEDRTEIKDEAILTEKVSEEQNVEEIEACLTETISEKTEDKITTDEDLSYDNIELINENITKEEKCFPDVITKEIEVSTLEHEPVEEQNDSQDEVSKEKFTDIDETAVEPQEDGTPSISLETSTEDTTNSDKTEAVNENLPIEKLESVSKVHIPEVMPKSEDSKTKEECHISATATYVDEEIGTATKEISSYENLETHVSTQQPDNSYSIAEENVTQSEIQLNSTEGCSEMVKDVVLTEEIEQVPLEIEKEKGINDFKEQIVEEDSYCPELEDNSTGVQKEILHEISISDSVPAEKSEVTEVSVDGHIGQEDLHGKEDISCQSKVTNDVDQKEEGISSLEDAAKVESQVDLSNRESTAYPSESEKLATRALESKCEVQIAEVVADSEDSKVKEECIVLEQDTKTNEILSAPDNEQETVTEAPTKSDEAKNSDLTIEEKALTKENLETHGELEPTSEPVIEEDQVTIETKSQPKQSDITCENITNDQTVESKLEEDVTLAPENEIKSIESQNETTKNIILTDEVSVETEKEKEINEIEGQVLEEDNCPTLLDNASTPDQKGLENEEIEYSKPISVENTEVTEVKAESQIEVEDIKAIEDLSCLSKASSIIETSKVEHEDTEQTTTIKEVKDDSIDEASKDTIVPLLEDSKASELQFTYRGVLEEKDGEKYSEEEAQGNFGVEIEDAKSGNEAVEDVIIDEVLLEDEKAKESKSIKDIINEEAKVNQLTSDTDEVCQIEISSSRPDELLETKDSVEDTKESKFIADNLNVKDETLTIIKGSNEDSEIVASELKKLNTVTDKEKETLEELQADDSAKTTYGSILSSEVAEIVPECREASATLTDNLSGVSPEILQAKHEDNITEDRESLPSVEKDAIDVQKHKRDLDHETELRTADVVSNVECSKIEPRHVDTKEATLEFKNQENQKEHKKEVDESIEAVIPVEDMKTSTREPEVGSVDLEVPSVMDATADKANSKTVEVQLESTCDQSKPIEESSGMKQEPLELDAPVTLGTAAAEDLKISPKYVTDDLIKVSQTHPEIQEYEVQKESTESKILTEKIDPSHEQWEPVTKSLIPVAANLKPDTASVSIDQKEKSESAEPANIVLHELAKGNSEVAKDQQVEKEEIGVKTDEEYEEEEDNEDDEKMGSCSDAPVMVEASKDIEVKVHKKSHNILSGVGSKVKHSIAKVKKAITGKSSPPKSPPPKVKDQVIG